MRFVLLATRRELSGSQDTAPLDWTAMERTVADIHRQTAREIKRTPQPRVVKSHFSFTPEYPNVVYLIRDPLPVAASYLRFLRRAGEYHGEAGESLFVERFCHGGLDRFGTWGEHVESWMAARGPDRMTVVSYDDARSHPHQAVARLVKSLHEVDLDAGAIDRIVATTELEKLRESEQVTFPKSLRGTGEADRFVGAGSLASQRAWTTVLRPESVEAIGGAFAEIARRRLGSFSGDRDGMGGRS